MNCGIYFYSPRLSISVTDRSLDISKTLDLLGPCASLDTRTVFNFSYNFKLKTYSFTGSINFGKREFGAGGAIGDALARSAKSL